MWQKLLRALGCASYLAVLLVIFATVSYMAFSQFVKRGVTPTPELFGLNEEDARALLADQGLRLEWSDEGDRFDETVPAGHILLQQPSAGTLVKRGRTVTIVLSRGTQTIEVPEVVGGSLQAAQVSLAAAGLKMGRTFNVFSREGTGGMVVAQHPQGGRRVEREALVDLFISLENTSTTYVMPDLVRQNYDTVRRFFESRGFRLGRVIYETYDGIAPGTILRQYPLAGHPLHQGDVISLGVVTPEDPFGLEAGDDSENEPGSDDAAAPAGAQLSP